MAIVKFDVSDSNPEDATRDFEQPTPGVYKAKVKEINPGFTAGDGGKPDKNKPRLEVIYEITDDKFKGSRLWDYVSFSDASKWKLDQFLQAVGAADKKKRKGELNTDKVVNMPVRIRVKGEQRIQPGTSEVEYRAKVGGVFAAKAEDSDGNEDELPTGEEAEESLSVLGAMADQEDEGAQDKLTELASEAGLDPDDFGTWEELAAALDEVELASDPEPEPGEEPEEGTADGGEEDLEALAELADENEDDESIARLTELAEEAGLDPDEYGTWAELVVALGGEGGEAANDDGYDDMSVPDLKAELKARELETTGSKPALIARLRENDESVDPF